MYCVVDISILLVVGRPLDFLDPQQEHVLTTIFFSFDQWEPFSWEFRPRCEWLLHLEKVSKGTGWHKIIGHGCTLLLLSLGRKKIRKLFKILLALIIFLRHFTQILISLNYHFEKKNNNKRKKYLNEFSKKNFDTYCTYYTSSDKCRSPLEKLIFSRRKSEKPCFFSWKWAQFFSCFCSKYAVFLDLSFTQIEMAGRVMYYCCIASHKVMNRIKDGP